MLDKIPLREDGSYCSSFFILAAIMNSLRYTFSSSGEIFSNSLSSFRASWRNFRAMFRSYIVFFFVFSFSCWAISLSTSSFDTSINLDLESSSITSRIFRFQWDKSSTILKLHQNYWQRRRWERHDLLCNHNNADLFTCENNVLSSRVKISCFCMKAHLVFHWCLYNNVQSML